MCAALQVFDPIQKMSKLKPESCEYVIHTDLCLNVLYTLYRSNSLIYWKICSFQDPEKPGDKPHMQEYEVDLDR